MGGRVQVGKEGDPVEVLPDVKYQSPGRWGGHSSLGKRTEVEQETGYTEVMHRMSNLLRIMRSGVLTVGKDSCKY